MQMQFGRQPADLPSQVPERVGGFRSNPKKPDIQCVGLRVITLDQTQQGRFAGTVWSDQRPIFILTHGPGNVIEDAFAAQPDADVAQFDERRSGIPPDRFFRGRERGQRQGGRNRRQRSDQWMVPQAMFRSMRHNPVILHEQQMGGARRQFIRPVGDEQHGQSGAHQPLNDAFQARAGGTVETAERVVENQQTGRLEQGVNEKDLALLAIRQGGEFAPKQRFYAQPTAEPPAIFAKPAGVVPGAAHFKRVALLDTGLRKKPVDGKPAFGEATVPAGLVERAFRSRPVALGARRKQGDGFFGNGIGFNPLEMAVNFPSLQRHLAAQCKRQQRFPRTIGAEHGPLFAAPPGPAGARKYDPPVPADGNAIENKPIGIRSGGLGFHVALNLASQRTGNNVAQICRPTGISFPAKGWAVPCRPHGCGCGASPIKSAHGKKPAGSVQ